MRSILATVLFCLLARTVQSARSLSRRSTANATKPADVSGKTYNYIIAGGGLTGVVLAARLAENASTTVLLIEAGYDQENNPNVYNASRYQSTFGTALDWTYKTVPQTTADGKPQTMRAGKGLGGSTIINGMAWSKPHTFQVDALEQLGNPGLNWSTLSPFMKMAETWTPSTIPGLTYNTSCHGTGGPVSVEYDPNVAPANVEEALNSTIQGLGLPYPTDLSCGNPAGGAPMANDRRGGIRDDTFRSYLYHKTPSNLVILTGNNVGRVLLSNDSIPRATGVEFQDGSGKKYQAYVDKEVLLATGSLKTPAILQWSGIGPSSVLSAANISVRVDLPVGQNLIDQTTSTTDFTFSGDAGGGQDVLFPRFQDMFKGDDAALATFFLTSSLSNYAQDAVNAGAFNNVTALEYILGIQADWILNKSVAVSETFDYTYSNVFGYDSWFLLPFSRGYVQVLDDNPYGGRVSINPRYYATEFDLMAQALTAKFTRTVSTSEPLSRYISGEWAPGSSVNNSTSSWEAWVKTNYRSNWHPIGTVSMMSAELGGCLDPAHRVYGTVGLRVVDASSLPVQQSSHLMTVLYGLSERAAALITAGS